MRVFKHIQKIIFSSLIFFVLTFLVILVVYYINLGTEAGLLLFDSETIFCDIDFLSQKFMSRPLVGAFGFAFIFFGCIFQFMFYFQKLLVNKPFIRVGCLAGIRLPHLERV